MSTRSAPCVRRLDWRLRRLGGGWLSSSDSILFSHFNTYPQTWAEAAEATSSYSLKGDCPPMASQGVFRLCSVEGRTTVRNTGR